MSFPVRAQPLLTQMRRGRLLAAACRHVRVDGLKRPSGRNASPSGITPSNITSPAPEPTRGPRTEVRLGARAHKTRPTNRAHAPPAERSSTPTTPRTTRLTCGPRTNKAAGRAGGWVRAPARVRALMQIPRRLCAESVTENLHSASTPAPGPSPVASPMLFMVTATGLAIPGEIVVLCRFLDGCDGARSPSLPQRRLSSGRLGKGGREREWVRASAGRRSSC
jgi:hypothetical protein